MTTIHELATAARNGGLELDDIRQYFDELDGLDAADVAHYLCKLIERNEARDHDLVWLKRELADCKGDLQRTKRGAAEMASKTEESTS